MTKEDLNEKKQAEETAGEFAKKTTASPPPAAPENEETKQPDGSDDATAAGELQAKIAELEEKVKALTETSYGAKAETALEKAVKGTVFSSELAEETIKNVLRNLEYDGEKASYKGVDEKLAELKKTNPEFFKEPNPAGLKGVKPVASSAAGEFETEVQRIKNYFN
jgi:hypothetical protein